MKRYRWTEQDLAEREARLNASTGYLQAMAKDQAKRERQSPKQRRFEEMALQQRIVRHYRELQAAHKGRLPWLHHCSNEEDREHRRLIDHQMGVSPGVPDLLFFGSGAGTCVGLALELKVRPNGTTADQDAWLEHLSGCGWRTAVCFSDQETLDVIYDYCGLGR